jgi:hypothetical protein
VTEIAIVVLLGVLGFIAYRDILALRRWDPDFLRSGVVVVRHSVPVHSSPTVLPEPRIPSSWFGWRAQVRRLGPLEVAFTAQTSNAPVLKGLLTFNPAASAVVLTGRVFWGLLPLFVLGLGGLALAHERSSGIWVFLALAAFVAADYWFERRRLLMALSSVAAELEGVGRQGP